MLMAIEDQFRADSMNTGRLMGGMLFRAPRAGLGSSVIRGPQVRGTVAPALRFGKEIGPPANFEDAQSQLSYERGMMMQAKNSITKVKVGSTAVGAVAAGAAAAGAVAFGALAIGALAIGAMTVKRLRILEARIEKLSVGKLTVDHLEVRSQQTRGGSSSVDE